MRSRPEGEQDRGHHDKPGRRRGTNGGRCMMRFSTASVARMCSRHPGRTLAAWGVVVPGAIAALLLVLTGFTTEAAATDNQQSERANDRLAAAFAPNALSKRDLQDGELRF